MKTLWSVVVVFSFLGCGGAAEVRRPSMSPETKAIGPVKARRVRAEAISDNTAALAANAAAAAKTAKAVFKTAGKEEAGARRVRAERDRRIANELDPPPPTADAKPLGAFVDFMLVGGKLVLRTGYPPGWGIAVHPSTSEFILEVNDKRVLGPLAPAVTSDVPFCGRIRQIPGRGFSAVELDCTL